MYRLVCTAVLLFGNAAFASPPPDDHNAATWYQQAIDQYNRFKTDSPADLEAIMNCVAEDSNGLTPQVRAALERIQPILDLARHGSAQDVCDFALDRSQGVDLLLPHLGALRGIAKIMKAEALVRMNDGDASAAAGLASDMYRMSGHFADDRVVISSLVGQAVFSLTDGTVQMGIDRGAFGEAESQKLLDGLSRLNTTDPFDYLEAVTGEQEMMVSWLSAKFDDEQERDRIFGEMEQWGGSDDVALRALDKDGFEAALDDYDSVMNRVVEAFANPDPSAAKAAMKELEAEIELHQHGPLAQIMLPAFGKILERREIAKQMLADRLTTLRALAGGKSTPDDLANAAIWYVRGVDMLEKLDPKHLEAIRAFAADTSAPLNPDLTAALTSPDVQAVIDVFREGSRKKRCDFAFARRTGAIYLVPPYDPGMHDAIRLLRADAVRLLRSGETWDGADRLALAISASGHLGNDPFIVSSLIAHAGFIQSMSLVQTALNDSMLGEEHKPLLGDALERAGHKDPFGYIGAIIAMRNQLADSLAPALAHGDTADDERLGRERAVEQLKPLGADQQFYLLAVFATLQENAMAREAAAAANQPPSSNSPLPSQSFKVPADALTRLADVISQPDLEAAQAQIPRIAPMLMKGDLEFLGAQIIPAIAASRTADNLSDHIRRARADLRNALQVVRPQASSKESPDAVAD